MKSKCWKLIGGKLFNFCEIFKSGKLTVDFFGFCWAGEHFLDKIGNCVDSVAVVQQKILQKWVFVYFFRVFREISNVFNSKIDEL